jgi:hypothetical protein
VFGEVCIVCDPKRRGEGDSCVVKYDQVKDIIRTTKERWVDGWCYMPITDCLCGCACALGWVFGTDWVAAVVVGLRSSQEIQALQQRHAAHIVISNKS